MLHLYADALQRIDDMNGVVKLDFVTFLPGTGAADDSYEAEPCLRLVMNPHALAALHARLAKLLAELERAGVVERVPAGDAGDGGSGGNGPG